MNQNKFKEELVSCGKKMEEMLEYHRVADGDCMLIFLDFQLKFHKDSYLRMKDLRDKIKVEKSESRVVRFGLGNVREKISKKIFEKNLYRHLPNPLPH